MKRSGMLEVAGWVLIAVACAVLPGAALAAEQPNILWITSEDNSPYLGCYGDAQALTPNLDHLATEGVRYANAFANAPVCSAARSTLAMGMYAPSLGIHNHRSRVRVPEQFRPYPEHLRAAGYYCTNNSKTDYNFVQTEKNYWDESSNEAHYRNRKPGQPFFAVFNIGASHEGQLTYSTVEKRRKDGTLPAEPRIAPEDIVLPPYHADTPVVRRDWSVYYDNMTLMDAEVGRMLEELEAEGLAEDTIVFYYADHGGALPRGKRNIHDTGTRVPMIVRFPGKWAHLAPAKPGEWVTRPVSFVDLPPTVFSLLGVPIPENFEGRAFLGEKKEEWDNVFLFRGRMDERYDTVRAVRNERYRYVRNYSPHRPWGQQYSYPFRVLPSMASWYEAYINGECNPVQARYWQTKPSEEFYDLKKDPYDIKNLIGKTSQKARIAKLREALDAHLIATRDTGFIPESMFGDLAGDATLYDYAQSEAYPIERIVRTANLASEKNAKDVPALIKACNANHPVLRYWGATGLLIRQADAAPAKDTLLALLEDDYAAVRVAAAEALGYLGSTEKALTTLALVLDSENRYATLAALNTLDFMYQAGHVPIDTIKKMVKDLKFVDVSVRMQDYFLNID